MLAVVEYILYLTNYIFYREYILKMHLQKLILVTVITSYGSAIGNVVVSDAAVDWKDASSNPRPIELDTVFSWGFPHHLQTNVGRFH